MSAGPDVLLQMYAGMVRVRLFEERGRELFAAGRIPGFLHTSIGQEAVAVGAAVALRPDDYVFSTHRGHGHLVAKGGSLRGLMAELYGRPPLEAFATPGAADVVAAVRQVLK